MMISPTEMQIYFFHGIDLLVYYPLVNVYLAIENTPFILDLPIKKMVIFKFVM